MRERSGAEGRVEAGPSVSSEFGVVEVEVGAADAVVVDVDALFAAVST